MASPLTRGITTAIKRTRSTSSLPRQGAVESQVDTSPANNATDDAQDAESESAAPLVPAFLRQSKPDVFAKFTELNWQEKIRIMNGRQDPDSVWAQLASQGVLQRNRYLGLYPWDRSRIRLRVDEGESDYINASPILLQDSATGTETQYIATQGPKRNGISHFWQMIWHETDEVAVIVMLTPTEESGKEKCFQYFPLDAESSPFQITTTGHSEQLEEGEIAFEEYEDHGHSTQVRKLKLSFGNESKVVWHLLFTAFPDFGIPEDQDRAELLDLIQLSATKNSHAGNPRTIHCSAGVGRSGTFIALEHLLSLLTSGQLEHTPDDEDPVFDVVSQLREQRMMMVQSDTQYQFLYDVVLEELQKKQLASQLLEMPSPKLRRLNDGMKVTALDEIEGIKPERTPELETDGSKDAESESENGRSSSEVYEDAVSIHNGGEAGHVEDTATTIVPGEKG